MELMRLALVFLVIATLIIGFLVFDQFPGLLEGHPKLRELNNKARELVGLEIRDMTYLPDKKLADPQAVLRQEAATDEMRAVCGDPPDNPWSGESPPTEVDLDRYSLALEMWRYCVRNQKKQDLLPLLGAQGRDASSQGRLKPYEE